ncbi:MAG: type II toxin-antitoxin system RelE/ParE family toxin [Hyphomicrobiales bacterium]|nr:type II toxin-antitoxin system RelE/ParE family toxin [Hyphomicrobiales bacterium]
MARFRLSAPAEADLAGILAASAARWGPEGRRRYAALLAAALRRVAADPEGPATRDRADLTPGIRSLHIRHARGDDPRTAVKRPAHIDYYRATRPGSVEIVRVLHERMEPSRHVGMGGD